MSKRKHDYHPIVEIKPNEQMIKEAKKLKTGKILIVYKDIGRIRMETEDSDDTYVWRNGTWRPMIMNRRIAKRMGF